MIADRGPRHLIVPKPPRRPLAVLPPGHYEPTAGARCECARDVDCINAHLAAHPHGDTPARCPGLPEEATGAWLVTCRWYLAPTRERATSFASSGRGAGGE